MNIIEAISESPLEVTTLTSSYIGRIYIDGVAIKEIPVDMRLKRIRIPLHLSDIEFIYDKKKTSERIHRTDTILSTYFPIGSTLILSNLPELELISYGSIKTYNNQVYVDMYCTIKDVEKQLIETINTDQLKEKVKDEMNIMVQSNEIIKTLLPQYNSNCIRFSDDDLDAIKKYNATKILNIIDKLEGDELYDYMENINSALKQHYTTLPESIIRAMTEISDITIKDKVKAGFAGVHSYYNPRYVLEWLIYIFENDLITDETYHDEFYLLNKLDGKCTIRVDKILPTYSDERITSIVGKAIAGLAIVGNGDNPAYMFTFTTPDECDWNYRLYIDNVATYGNYIKYNIESIRLDKFEKIDPSNVINIENISVQPDNLKTATEVISILSATNYKGITLQEYYDNIDTYLNAIKIETYTDSETEGDEDI